MFKKADDYISSIFIEQEECDDKFNLYFASKNHTSIAGNFKNGQESYSLTVRPNCVGLNINNGKYIFSFQRRPITSTEEFQFLFEDDEELEKRFKDVEYVECFESDKVGKSISKVEYLVNKSEYLLIGYEKILEHYCLSVELKDEFLCEEYFNNIGLDRPSNPNFDISKSTALFFVPDEYHTLFDIKENDDELRNKKSRRDIIQNVCSTIMLSTDKIWYRLKSDSQDCVFSTKESLVHRFGKDILDER